uniref:Uncharacterized protein n=1 Tax=Ditylenchus dipsaci TaxID=166011 RepID=A0A915DPA2_9BILA
MDCDDASLPSNSIFTTERICAESKDKKSYLALLRRFGLVIVSDQTANFEFILLDVLEVGEAAIAIISDDYLPPSTTLLTGQHFH